MNGGVEGGAVDLVGLVKRFGHGAHEVVAVDGVDLTIEPGEFFSLLGPSGSGKTTVLRLVAGFERPDAGHVRLGGADVTHVPPHRRNVNTVFQDYALFPHLSVQENVEYGLRVRGVGRAERRRRAGETLEVVRLGAYGRRRPDQMSGGQRQRVALARALVNRPSVLLLDEPLGALDLKLREEMQVELKSIQREVGITFVLVTHDQGEALSMSSRIAVFNQGRIEQVGTPLEVYERPTTPFVASFVGTANVLDDALSRRLVGRGGRHALRPERVAVATDAPTAADAIAGGAGAGGVVDDVQYVGIGQRVHVALDDGGTLHAFVPAHQVLELDQRVWLSWPPDAARPVADDPGSPHQPATTTPQEQR